MPRYLSFAALSLLTLAAVPAIMLRDHVQQRTAARPDTAAQHAAGYDELADSARELAVARRNAAASGKLLLVVFGANWCRDCRGFAGELETVDLARAVEANYDVVKIDVGRFKKNTDIARGFGLDVRRGIPAVVIARASGEAADVADGRRMEQLRKAGLTAMVAFFQAGAASARQSASAAPGAR